MDLANCAPQYPRIGVPIDDLGAATVSVVADDPSSPVRAPPPPDGGGLSARYRTPYPRGGDFSWLAAPGGVEVMMSKGDRQSDADHGARPSPSGRRWRRRAAHVVDLDLAVELLGLSIRLPTLSGAATALALPATVSMCTTGARVAGREQVLVVLERPSRRTP